MISYLLAVGTTERFSIIVGLLVGILTLIGMFGHMSWKFFSLIDDQLTATRENTSAIKKLDARMARLEQRELANG